MTSTKYKPAELQALEEFWGATVPTDLALLYRLASRPILLPCAFHSLETLARGEGREFGGLPAFLPFGDALDREGRYGFYARPGTTPDAWPVLFADDTEGFYRPVSSHFRAFVGRCLLFARDEDKDTEGTQNTNGSDSSLPHSVDARVIDVKYGESGEEDLDTENDLQEASLPLKEVQRALSFPEAFLTQPAARNETEWLQMLIGWDAGDAVSRCSLGCEHLLHREDEAALELFIQARKAAPWFGDASFLIADTYRNLEDLARAVPAWWETAQCLLAFCTRTWEYNLGADYPEAEIYEITADCLAQFERAASSSLIAAALWRAITKKDPYDAENRFALAQTLRAQSDLNGADREFLNALYLSAGHDRALALRCYSELESLYVGQGRQTEHRLLSHDRTLPDDA